MGSRRRASVAEWTARLNRRRRKRRKGRGRSIAFDRRTGCPPAEHLVAAGSCWTASPGALRFQQGLPAFSRDFWQCLFERTGGNQVRSIHGYRTLVSNSPSCLPCAELTGPRCVTCQSVFSLFCCVLLGGGQPSSPSTSWRGLDGLGGPFSRSFFGRNSSGTSPQRNPIDFFTVPVFLENGGTLWTHLSLAYFAPCVSPRSSLFVDLNQIAQRAGAFGCGGKDGCGSRGAN